MENAANEANRDGSALVTACRLLRKLLSQPDVEGADLRNIVFSAIMDQSLLSIWVHWAEVHKGAKTKFHMTRLKSFAIQEESQLGAARRMVHNILDWGCGARFEELKTNLYKDIVAFGQKLAKEAKERSNKKQKPN